MSLCGMDECGRGALAGPLVAAAVVLDTDPEELRIKSPAPIRDSKILSRLQREKLVEYFSLFQMKVEIFSINVDVINDKGIGWVNREVFEVLSQRILATQYIVDGNLKLEIPNYESRIKADQTVLEVSVASIIAKVYRDNLMRQLHLEFPMYGWDNNVGYGTLFHRTALLEHGACEQHRVKFIDSILG